MLGEEAASSRCPDGVYEGNAPSVVLWTKTWPPEGLLFNDSLSRWLKLFSLVFVDPPLPDQWGYDPNSTPIIADTLRSVTQSNTDSHNITLFGLTLPVQDIRVGQSVKIIRMIPYRYKLLVTPTLVERGVAFSVPSVTT